MTLSLTADPIVVTSIPNGDISAAVGLKGIRNIAFTNIVAKAEQGMLFAAFGKGSLSNITLGNVSLAVAAITRLPTNASWQVPASRAVHDYRPLSGAAAARETPQEPRAAVDGMYITGRSQVRLLGNVSVTFVKPFREQWSLKCINVAAASATVDGKLSRCVN